MHHHSPNNPTIRYLQDSRENSRTKLWRKMPVLTLQVSLTKCQTITSIMDSHDELPWLPTHFISSWWWNSTNRWHWITGCYLSLVIFFKTVSAPWTSFALAYASSKVLYVMRVGLWVKSTFKTSSETCWCCLHGLYKVHPQISIKPTIVSLKFWYGAWGKNLSPKSRSHHLLKHTLSFLNTPRLGVCIDQCCIRDNIWFNVGKLHLRAGPEWPVRYSIHLLSESCIPWKASSCTSKLLYSLLEQVFLRKWSPKIQKSPLWKPKFIRLNLNK